MINLEEVKTIYFDADAIRLPEYHLGRVSVADNNGGRLYYRYGYQEGQSVELFNSLTTVIYQCTPMAHSLLEWYCRHGLEEARRIANTAAKYGTLMHIEIGKFCQSLTYNFDAIDQVVEDYLAAESFWQPECKEWPWRLKQDMAAWAEFVFDTRLKCIAVEMVLCSAKGYATAIDVVCDLDLPVKGFHGETYVQGPRKGQPKETIKAVRKRALINMKSGRHAFYSNNGLQVAAEALLFTENFPDIQIEAALNWAPSDWESPQSDGKYKLKDWTGQVDPRELTCMFELAEVKFRDKLQAKERLNIYGEVLYGNSPEGNISTRLLTDAIRARELAKRDPSKEEEPKHQMTVADYTKA